MSHVLRDLRLIVSLSDRGNYTFTDDEVKQMFDAYEDLGKQVQAYFFHPRVVNLPSEFHFSPIEP